MTPQYVGCQNIDEGTFRKPMIPVERSLCEYQGVGCVQTNRHGVIHPHFEAEGAAMKESLIDDSRAYREAFWCFPQRQCMEAASYLDCR
jgi:hypothetical protein